MCCHTKRWSIVFEDIVSSSKTCHAVRDKLWAASDLHDVDQMPRKIGKPELAIQLSELNEKVKYYDIQRQQTEEAEADVSLHIAVACSCACNSTIGRPLMSSMIPSLMNS